MLIQLLTIIETNSGPLRLDELAQRLDVPPAVVTQMLRFWQRKGRLQIVSPEDEAACEAHGGCGDAQSCPFVVQLPTSTIRLQSK